MFISIYFLFFWGNNTVTVRPVRVQVNVKERIAELLLLLLVIPVATTEIMSVNLSRDYYIGFDGIGDQIEFRRVLRVHQKRFIERRKMRCDKTVSVQLTAGIFSVNGPNERTIEAHTWILSTRPSTQSSAK